MPGADFRDTAGGGRLRWRSAAKWVLAALLAINVLFLLLALSLANITAEGSGQRTMEHSFAILIEVDTYLDDHLETIRLAAFQAPDQAVTLPDLPLQLSFTAEEIEANDRAGFRALLLARAAERLYDDGVDSLRDDRSTEISFFSPQGAIDSGMDFLPSAHSELTRAVTVLAVLAAVLALSLVLSSRGYGRLLALGMAVLFAAGPFLILAVAVRFAFRIAADGADDYLASEYLELAQELTWAPIRNGMIFAVGGGIAALAGFGLARWSDAQQRV